MAHFGMALSAQHVEAAISVLGLLLPSIWQAAHRHLIEIA